MLRNAVRGISFPGKKRYEGVRFNVISVTREWVGIQFSGKKRYVTLEWHLTESNILVFFNSGKLFGTEQV